MKGKTLQPSLLYPARLSLRFEEEIKTFTDKQKLREFGNTKQALHQILKDLLSEKTRQQQETKIPQMTRLTSKGIYTVKIWNHPCTIMPAKSEIVKRWKKSGNCVSCTNAGHWRCTHNWKNNNLKQSHIHIDSYIKTSE